MSGPHPTVAGGRSPSARPSFGLRAPCCFPRAFFFGGARRLLGFQNRSAPGPLDGPAFNPAPDPRAVAASGQDLFFPVISNAPSSGSAAPISPTNGPSGRRQALDGWGHAPIGDVAPSLFFFRNRAEDPARPGGGPAAHRFPPPVTADLHQAALRINSA